MKKLYISCVSLSYGGAERVLSILSRPFAANFSEVRLFMWKDFPVFYNVDPRVKVINIEKECASKNIIQKMLWFRNIIATDKPNVILSFLANSSVKVILSTLGLSARIIAAERNDPRKLKGGWPMIWFRDFLYNYVSGIVEQTDSNRSYFKGCKLNKTKVIYNPILMNEKDIGLGLKTTKKQIIVTIGRLEHQKNHRLLIKAFQRVHILFPEVKLIIYGEGSYRKSLESLIDKEGLGDCISLPGITNDVFSVLKEARMFVLSSDYEGMPNALIEAMCVGVPCISTKVSGAIDLIKQDINGLLVDVGNADELTASMSELILNEGKCYKLANEAVKVYDQLKVEVVSKQWVDYINSFMV